MLASVMCIWPTVRGGCGSDGENCKVVLVVVPSSPAQAKGKAVAKPVAGARSCQSLLLPDRAAMPHRQQQPRMPASQILVGRLTVHCSRKVQQCPKLVVPSSPAQAKGEGQGSTSCVCLYASSKVVSQVACQQPCMPASKLVQTVRGSCCGEVQQCIVGSGAALQRQPLQQHCRTTAAATAALLWQFCDMGLGLPAAA
jgi:hypothetical protein